MQLRHGYVLVVLLATASSVLAQQPPTKEIYQDFRNKRPLHEELHMRGPDPDNEVKAEDEGLRITLAADRPRHWAVEVGTHFPISGDFEITGTFELLSVKRPTKGYGAGVNLVLADTPKRKKWAKVCRVSRVKEGSVHLTEAWAPYELRSQATEAKSGQLRFVRVGPSLRYLVSDGPGQEFREVWLQKEFGAEDLEYFGFGVSDSGEPGTPVDARLIDLRIRMGSVPPDKAVLPAPIAPPAPVPPVPVPAKAPDAPGSKIWIVVLLAGGLVLTLVLAGAVWLVLRSRHPASAKAPPITCPECGKKLRTKPGSTARKIKCPCGATVTVAQDEVDAS